jgi:hypothetical protein
MFEEDCGAEAEARCLEAYLRDLGLISVISA